MINKGAESLPNKDAQTYKQLAVRISTFRNTTMRKTTRKAWRMPISYWRRILIIPRPTLWRLCFCWLWGRKLRPLKAPSWDCLRARWRACSAGILAAPSTSRRRISSKLRNASRMLLESSLIMCRWWERLQLCRSKFETILIIQLLASLFSSKNLTWSKIGLGSLWHITFEETSLRFSRLWFHLTISSRPLNSSQPSWLTITFIEWLPSVMRKDGKECMNSSRRTKHRSRMRCSTMSCFIRLALNLTKVQRLKRLLKCCSTSSLRILSISSSIRSWIECQVERPLLRLRRNSSLKLQEFSNFAISKIPKNSSLISQTSSNHIMSRISSVFTPKSRQFTKLEREN